jgi:DNA-binding LytR/AlgR family response regulator
MLKVLIVEDDPLFAVDIEMCVDELGYENLGVYDTGEEAIEQLKQHAAEMLVCDIELKGKLTGLDVAFWGAGMDIPVVFVTSFQDEETFKKARILEPSAYLTKPFKATDLQRAMELAASNLEKKKVSVEAPKPLFIKHKNRLIKVHSDDISYVVSDGNYATFVTSKGRFVEKRSLLQIIKRLPADDFIRIHRSYVVKFDAITNVYPESQEVGIGDERLPIGRAYKADLMEKLDVL